MSERLTERMENVPDGESGVWVKNHDYITASKKLADYEDLEEQGLFLRLPVAVGTEVWTIMAGMTGKHPTLFRQRFELSMVQYWGTSVFLTRAEAEEKLRELESENKND